MLIEIPDSWIGFMKRMPGQKGICAGTPDLHMMNSSDIVQWISQAIRERMALTDVVMLFVSGGIAKRAEELQLITYDPGTHTWKGADYGKD